MTNFLRRTDSAGRVFYIATNNVAGIVATGNGDYIVSMKHKVGGHQQLTIELPEDVAILEEFVPAAIRRA